VTARRLRAVVAGFAIALASAVATSGAETADGPAAAGPLQIFTVPALADAIRERALDGACPRTLLPELVLAEAATLQQQIERGARADLLVTDDAAGIERLAASGLTGAPHRLAAGAATPATPYWIATLADAPQAAGAAAFLDFALSDRGQRLLGQAGLEPAAPSSR
jgi:ABC-type molybdate transport system substrate-binding protein